MTVRWTARATTDRAVGKSRNILDFSRHGETDSQSFAQEPDPEAKKFTNPLTNNILCAIIAYIINAVKRISRQEARLQRGVGRCKTSGDFC